MSHFTARPIVLCLSGLDPSGGAGLQADIESLLATGCQPTSIATCITAQNTQRITSWHPIDPGMLLQQAKLIFEDFKISAIKIGMIGTLETLEAIEKILIDAPGIPVILDPVLKSGQGQSLMQQELSDAIVERLVPLTSLLTPNSLEMRKLCKSATGVESGAFQLLAQGCQAVLLTGGHINTPKIRNKAWQNYQCIYDQCWPRLDGNFHGTGCTLASAAAGYLAHGMDMADAIAKADEFTWNCLANMIHSGKAQGIPTVNTDKKQPSTKAYYPQVLINMPQLYGIYTIDQSIHQRCLKDAQEAFSHGMKWFQLRYKPNSKIHSKPTKLALDLLELCQKWDVQFILNDHLDWLEDLLTYSWDIPPGIHIGQTDVTPETVRKSLGDKVLIGVTCHNSLKLAQKALTQKASYTAFGRFFPSQTKPDAEKAQLDTLRQARQQHQQQQQPIAVIGGITPQNVAPLVKAGADLIAVSGALWHGSPNSQHQHSIPAVCQSFHEIFAATPKLIPA